MIEWITVYVNINAQLKLDLIKFNCYLYLFFFFFSLSLYPFVIVILILILDSLFLIFLRVSVYPSVLSSWIFEFLIFEVKHYVFYFLRECILLLVMVTLSVLCGWLVVCRVWLYCLLWGGIRGIKSNYPINTTKHYWLVKFFYLKSFCW